MAHFKLTQSVNLESPSKLVEFEAVPVKSGDSDAHEWIITVMNGDSRAKLDGATCSCWFLRPNGTTVVVDGTISKNVCSVVFALDCYSVSGITQALMKLCIDSKYITIAECSLLVEDGDIGNIIDVSAGEGLRDLATLNAAFDDFTAEVDGKIARFGALESAFSVNATAKTVNTTSGWSVNVGPDVQFGQTADSFTVGASTYTDKAVTFPRAFSNKPVVCVEMVTSSTGANNGEITIGVVPESITVNGFTARFWNNSTSQRSPIMSWIAVAER